MKAVGRLALKSVVYFEIMTTMALFIGLAAVNLVRPGKGIHLAHSAEQGTQLAATRITPDLLLEHLAPQSIFDAAARNDVLQVVVFAILFGVSLGRVNGKSKQTMLAFFEGLSEVMFKFTALVMCFAPIGVGAAIASTVAQNGMGVLLSLSKLVATLYGALAAFVLLVFVPVLWLARIPVIRFLKTVREPALLAFSTASSEAALPDAMRLMEEFGVPRRIVSFVLPAGYSFNLDGTTLYLSLASVFIAQAAGIHLTLAQQLPMMLTLMLTSKGVAAVPRASLVILSGTLTTFGLPLEGVAVILGVDAFLDMARTSINLTGNCLASAVMARWEGEFNPSKEKGFPVQSVQPQEPSPPSGANQDT
jgi:proton glutamate symport protein